MTFEIDTETISEAGFDRYLVREYYSSAPSEVAARHTDVSNLVGGTIGAEGVLYLGSKQIRLDGKNKRIIINDGVTDRILIGYQSGGF